MDNEERDSVPDGKRYGVLKTPKRRRKIFINGELHHIIHINVPADVATTWNFIQNKMVRYPYKTMKKHAKKAYLINEVAKMVSRHPERIRIGITEGNIKRPQQSGPNGKFYFNEDEIHFYRKRLISMFYKLNACWRYCKANARYRILTEGI
jgi:hypothetical protein